MALETRKLMNRAWAVIDLDDDKMIYLGTSKKVALNWIVEYREGRREVPFRWDCRFRVLPPDTQPSLLLSVRFQGHTWGMMPWAGNWHFINYSDGSRRPSVSDRNICGLFNSARAFLVRLREARAKAALPKEKINWRKEGF